MITIGNVENRFAVLLFTLVIIVAVAYLDYITGSTLTFSFFYIIPISFLALYKRTTYVEIFACFGLSMRAGVHQIYRLQYSVRL